MALMTTADRKLARKVEREWKKANDPYFGKRRPGGIIGDKHSKAHKSKNACRKGNYDV